ncbi:hypothetical protein [Leifsonia sp. RAF41]|uniref:hypothetical protein n=1 Tax=Leifsonia sp. RAF41 TaxID=3233056 RepID=UPI003F9C9B8F
MPLLPALKSRVKSVIKRRLLAGRFRFRTWAYGTEHNGDVAVLMCLWNRPERLVDVLRMLDAQTSVTGVRLYLWNNARNDHEQYLSTLDGFRPGGALRSARLVRSPFNLGSIARFYWARKLVLTDGPQPIVVIDDDQDIQNDFLASALSQYDPKAVTAWWAWTLGPQGYWDRTPAEPGDRVDHIGPGGSVLSSEIIADERFFTRMPQEFWMLDDVWLSYFAKAKGYRLAKLDVPIQFVLDETNQHHGQADIKRAFFDRLASGAVPVS